MLSPPFRLNNSISSDSFSILTTQVALYKMKAFKFYNKYIIILRVLVLLAVKKKK